MLTKILDCDFADIHVGMNVAVSLRSVAGGRSMPFFVQDLL